MPGLKISAKTGHRSKTPQQCVSFRAAAPACNVNRCLKPQALIRPRAWGSCLGSSGPTLSRKTDTQSGRTRRFYGRRTSYRKKKCNVELTTIWT